MRPACYRDHLWAAPRVKFRVCTVLAALNLLGNLLALVLARD